MIRKIHYGSFRPGHYYHPVPGKAELQNHISSDELKGIYLDANDQLSLLKQLSNYSEEFNFPVEKNAEYRYYFNNSLFNKSDAMVLFLLMRHFKPRRVIEIGSGFSSALMLDTDDKFFSNNRIEFAFIEPNASRLKMLIFGKEQVKITEQRVQEVSKDIFHSLEENDILFIDSSHVTKYGSDVNHLIFNVLPNLKKGVLVHFHDICYPFEYPRDWLKKGIFWNEAYLLRAFLSFNNEFEIQLFNHFLGAKYSNEVKAILPDFKIGGSLWLRKV